jgi:hypothetical protein
MNCQLEINREGHTAGNPAICRLVCWKKHQDPKVLLEKVSRSESFAGESIKIQKFCCKKQEIQKVLLGGPYRDLPKSQ